MGLEDIFPKLVIMDDGINVEVVRNIRVLYFEVKGTLFVENTNVEVVLVDVGKCTVVLSFVGDRVVTTAKIFVEKL